MRILIAENHRGSREGLAALLAEEGYDVEAAVDGLTALRLAARRPPDVLIADYDLRDMTGAELTARIGELVPSCRVIAVSGWAGMCRDGDAPPPPPGVDRLGWLGLPVILKPIDPDALLGALRRIEPASPARL